MCCIVSTQDDAFSLQVNVEVKDTRTLGKGGAPATSYLAAAEFLRRYSILTNEVAHMRDAIECRRSYAVPLEHDPLRLLFHVTYHFGTATLFTEPLLYLMHTEDDDRYAHTYQIKLPYCVLLKSQRMCCAIVQPIRIRMPACALH
jgi:hypothetical protein